LDSIGRYELVEELGKGAMGVVYKAIDPTIGRDVALKTMRLDVHGVQADEVLRRFRNEARAAGTLSHPNIVTIFDAGEQQGVFYMAMEYIAGETLASVMASRRTFSTDEVLDLARQVCAGLDYAHSRGVVHRDIKPANIMVSHDGTLKIMDFGIAKLGGSMTLTGPVMGTPNYMSPEQVKGKPLDGRSDLFSLGVVLYEMLTGAKPFAGDNVTTIIYQIVHEEAVPPREVDLSIHPGLSAVVSRALAKSPDERYQRGAEMIRDLENYKSLAFDASAENSGDATMALEALRVEDSSQEIPDLVVQADESPEQDLPKTPEPNVHAERTSPPVSGRTAVAVTLLILIVGVLGWMKIHNRKTAVAVPAAAIHSADVAQPPSVPDTSATKSPVQVTPVAPAPSEVPAAPKRATTGALRLESTPDGAIVQIDGKSSDQWLTPFTVSHLKPGTHTVSAARGGVVSHKRSVEVSAGKRRVVKFNFPGQTEMPAQEATETAAEPESTRQSANPISKLKHFFRSDKPPANKGLLIVRTLPRGARVFIDEVVAPELTPARVPMDAGTYHVIVSLDGYKPIHRLITIQVGHSRKLDLSFLPE